MKGALTTAATLLALVVFAERQPYARYQSIVDRQMFGVPPPGFDPTKPPSEVRKSESKTEQERAQEQERLKSSIHFSVINVTPDGHTAVGFTDKSNPKLPHHYYLKVGEERDGWTVKEADAAAKTMTIVRGELEVSLTLGGDSSKLPDATGRTDAAAVPAVASSGGMPRSTLLGNRSALTSLRERRRQREQRLAVEEQQVADERRRLQEEKALREAHEKKLREQEKAEMRQQFLNLADEIRKSRMTAEKGGDVANEESAANAGAADE